MLAIYLDMFLLPKGAQAFPLDRKVEGQKNFIIQSSENVVDSAIAFYLPESGIVTNDNLASSTLFEDADPEGNIEELKIVQGKATEDIFIIYSAHDISDFHHGHKSQNSWAVEHMREGGYQDFTNDIKEIYTDVMAKLGKIPEPLPQLGPCPYPIEALTLWEVHTSRDWESQYDEIDSISYQGLGRTSLLVDKPNPLRCQECKTLFFEPKGPLGNPLDANDTIYCPGCGHKTTKAFLVPVPKIQSLLS